MKNLYLICVLLSALQLSSQTLQDRLLIYWEFNNNNSNTASSQYNLSPTNGVNYPFTEGFENLPNTAISCNGSQSLITDTMRIDSATNQWSVSVWVKPTKDIGGFVVGNKNFRVAPGPVFGNLGQFALAVLNDGRILFQVLDEIPLPINYFGDSLVGWDEWNHIVAVWDNDADSVYVYKNSVRIASGNTVNIQAKASTLWVGGYEQVNVQSGGGSSLSYSGLFDGSIDDVRIYTQALTTEQVNSLYLAETEDPLSIKAVKQAVHLFPNPTTNILHIAGDLPVEMATVYSLDGRLIMEVENTNHLIVDQLAPGMYILQLNTQRGIVNTRFIKQ